MQCIVIASWPQFVTDALLSAAFTYHLCGDLLLVTKAVAYHVWSAGESVLRSFISCRRLVFRLEPLY